MAIRITSETVRVRPPDPLRKKIEQLCRFLEIEETDTELVVKVVDPKKRTVVLSTGSPPLKIEAAAVRFPVPVASGASASADAGASATGTQRPPSRVVQPVKAG